MGEIESSVKAPAQLQLPAVNDATKNQSSLKWTAYAGSVVRRVISPRQLITAVQLQRARKSHRHTYDNAQLALYSRILPSDFLHFGYFEDPSQKPEDISLSQVAAAQNRYAELLLDLAGDRSAPVLDVGCGMGGLTRMLKSRGYTPTALTPDRLQATHIKATISDVPVIRCKFEDLPPMEHAHEFGTVYTAESLQYLKLDKALPILADILRPGGRWVACDYFYKQPSDDRSCHNWDEFVERLASAGWRLVYEKDITANVLPTLAYVHMWATRFGIPLMQFGFLRLRRKQPAVHHLMSGLLTMFEELAAKHLRYIDPVEFATGKRYMMIAMERA